MGFANSSHMVRSMKTVAIASLLLLVAVGGCQTKRAPERAANSPIVVVATVGMVADLVRNIGGDRVVVEQIMGSGVDPHLYKVTRDDVAIILSGDCVFYSGLMLEGKMSDTLNRLSQRQSVTAVTNAIDRKELLSIDESSLSHDPHVWMDVELWSKASETVAKTLSAINPQHAAEYSANLKTYQDKLAALDQYCKRAIESIPASNRILITSHDAFSYLGRAYGMEVVGVQGLSTESEAGCNRSMLLSTC